MEAFAVYQSVLKFDLQCILHCTHKPLEPFLSHGMKRPMLNHWSVELSDYNITFVPIRGCNNILAIAISWLKTLDIYRDPLENQTVRAINDTEKCIAEMVTNNIHTLSSDRLHAEQKKDITCRNLAVQWHL